MSDAAMTMRSVPGGRRRAHAPRRRQQGVTLMELMIVVVVVGLLAAVGYPSFREQGLRSGRAEARAALLAAASRQEQFYLNNKTYTADLSDLGMPVATEHGKYTVSVDDETEGCPLSTCFAMTATPQAGQADDAACGNLTVNSSGAHGASGTEPTGCW